jgi:hypothetical protein
MDIHIEDNLDYFLMDIHIGDNFDCSMMNIHIGNDILLNFYAFIKWHTFLER